MLTEHRALQAEPRLTTTTISPLHQALPSTLTSPQPRAAQLSGPQPHWASFCCSNSSSPSELRGLHSCCPLHQECAPHPTAGSPSSFGPQLKWHCLQKALPDHLAILSHMTYSFPAQSSHHCPQLSTYLYCLCVFAYLLFYCLLLAYSSIRAQILSVIFGPAPRLSTGHIGVKNICMTMKINE